MRLSPNSSNPFNSDPSSPGQCTASSPGSYACLCHIKLLGLTVAPSGVVERPADVAISVMGGHKRQRGGSDIDIGSERQRELGSERAPTPVVADEGRSLIMAVRQSCVINEIQALYIAYFT